ncbi:hypothetical protein ACFVZJ_18170 [Streptomyces sp. NPDC058322]|uniref:hypothetical protein n=1 Tax=unclassified Streptomyces TaxID=2593676 RepID=UPI0036DFDA4F
MGTVWQRRLRLVQNHVQADGTLPEASGDVVVQGEDLGPRRSATVQGRSRSGAQNCSYTTAFASFADTECAAGFPARKPS